MARCSKELLTQQGGHKADAAAQHRAARHIQSREHGEGEQGQANDVQQFKERDLISGDLSINLHLAGVRVTQLWVKEMMQYRTRFYKTCVQGISYKIRY